MKQPTLSHTVVPAHDVEHEEYYKIEFSLQGQEDWAVISSTTFDSEEMAEKYMNTRFYHHRDPNYTYEYRLVRVRVEMMEVGRWE
jgi:hypothetical protein